MDKGTKVYQSNVYSDPLNASRPFYMNVGETTGIVIDGVPMVRFHTMLVPMNGSGNTWHASEAEAKRDAWLELVRKAGAMQALADTLLDEIAHDDLTTEEAVA